MDPQTSERITAAIVADWVCDSRQRTLDIVADLANDQLMGPQLGTVNPLLWEIGHVAWFHEKWLLRHAHGRQPLRPDADALWDSMAIDHDTRWDLPLPSRQHTIAYMTAVRDAVVDALRADVSDDYLYRTQYCVFHEDMHTEAFTYTRQTLGYPAPVLKTGERGNGEGGPVPGDAAVHLTSFPLGADPGAAFAFDNEKWMHTVPLEPFRIARGAVTQEEFAAFVDDGGYGHPEFWSEAGSQWRRAEEAQAPVYWRREPGGGWSRRDFDRWVPLEKHKPMVHINWFEADAYCRWAGRRLPSEAEWEAAATVAADGATVPSHKPRFPWGNQPVTSRHANVDSRTMGCVDVGALPDGDSAIGCRQMIGNVWEWTASDFLPYPDFERDFYAEYSEPWFAGRKVLRGGAWATRGRMLRNTWRNFYEPHRRDVLAGFRTCALAE